MKKINLFIIISAITTLFSIKVLALIDCNGLKAHSILTTYSLPCVYYPGAPIGSCDGFTQLQADSTQLKAEQQQRSLGKIVMSVELGKCNYSDFAKDGSMGPYYCDIVMCIR